jgi:hypothetical protein
MSTPDGLLNWPFTNGSTKASAEASLENIFSGLVMNDEHTRNSRVIRGFQGKHDLSFRIDRVVCTVMFVDNDDIFVMFKA